MGIFDKTKAALSDADVAPVRKAAAEAYVKGAGTYAPTLEASIIGGSTTNWGVMVDAVEAEGWVLVHWAVAPSTLSESNVARPAAFPLFRRRQ
jgi:hypothetical protein